MRRISVGASGREGRRPFGGAGRAGSSIGGVIDGTSNTASSARERERTRGTRDGILKVNLEESVALSNKPLQRLNAYAARSIVGCAATPRAGARGSSRPWYDRASVRRSPLNGKTLAGPCAA